MYRPGLKISSAHEKKKTKKKKRKNKEGKERNAESDSEIAYFRTKGLAERANEHIEHDRRQSLQLIKRKSEGMDNLNMRKAASMPAMSNVTSAPKDDDKECVIRVDGVVATVALAEILVIAAIALEAYVSTLDQQWNSVIRSEARLDDIQDHSAFHGKTINFDSHLYLKKAKEYATRNEDLEILFLVLVSLASAVALIQICACYMFCKSVEQFSLVLCGLFAVVGALCIYSSTFLVTAVTNIENNYMYAADMLLNFQHHLDSSPGAVSPDECKDDTTKVYMRGCAPFEYAKQQAKDIESGLRLCGDGSRYARYYSGGKMIHQSVQIQKEIYTRQQLKQVGLCSRDGYKYGAAVLAVLAGITFSAVPVIYCCDWSVKSGKMDKPLPPEIDDGDPSFEKYTPAAAISQFREYVEKESDEDIKDAAARPREIFQF